MIWLVLRRRYLSVWEARDFVRSFGFTCSAERICALARSGDLKATKYNGRWRVHSFPLWISLMRKRRSEGK